MQVPALLPLAEAAVQETQEKLSENVNGIVTVFRREALRELASGHLRVPAGVNAPLKEVMRETGTEMAHATILNAATQRIEAGRITRLLHGGNVAIAIK